MVDLVERMAIDPNGDLRTASSVVAGVHVYGGIVQARAGGYLQSLGELHVNGRGVLNNQLSARVAGHHGVAYFGAYWSSFYGDWDWGGGGHIYHRANAGTDAHIGTASDERLKQDIKPSTFDCLASVLKWPLYQFRWKETGDAARIGFIAQRQNDVFPESVAKGRPEDGTWSINTLTMLAALTGAVQQLAARVEALEAARG